MGCNRQSLIKNAPVSGVNVRELEFVSCRDGRFQHLLRLSDYLSGRWTAAGISYL